MLNAVRRKEILFPELSYANPDQTRLKRWFIRSVEGLSGRDRYARLYAIWRREIAPTGDRIFGRMLDLIDVSLTVDGFWPRTGLPEGPLVIVANHPFGIGDGIAVLSMAEQLGRPFRVLINSELLKIEEIRAYSLPIDFNETKEALKNNLAVRKEALALLKAGVTVVVFPGGGVATAPRGFGKAADLPWKMFPARLIQEAKASVIPVHFHGQNGRLFHIVSGPMNMVEEESKLKRMVGQMSLTLRTSLLIREFIRLSGKSISARVGEIIPWTELEPLRDRKDLIAYLHRKVFSLSPPSPVRGPALRRRFRNRKKGSGVSLAR